MFNSAILDVAVGLVFIYTQLSLVCSSLKEGVSRLRGMRAQCLAAGIHRLLANDGSTEIAERFWRHPLIQAMGDGRNAAGVRRFSYLPARTFALAYCAPRNRPWLARCRMVVMVSMSAWVYASRKCAATMRSWSVLGSGSLSR